MPLSNTTKEALIDALTARSRVNYSYLYVGLCSTNSSAAAPGTELAVGPSGADNTSGYHRVMLNRYSDSSGHYDRKMSPATIDSTGKVFSKNVLPVMFFKADSDWGEIKSVAFFSEETDGTYIGYCNLNEDAITVKEGDVVNFDVGELTLTLVDTED